MSVLHAYETMSYGPAPESPADAVAWLDRHGRAFGHYIDGEWSGAAESFPSLDPSNGQEIATIAQGGEKDVERAVRAGARTRRELAVARSRLELAVAGRRRGAPGGSEMTIRRAV